MSRPKPRQVYAPLNMRIPVEWKRALEKQAESRHTSISDFLRPHIGKVVDAIVTLQETDKAA